jgi:hypothetical protein
MNIRNISISFSPFLSTIVKSQPCLQFCISNNFMKHFTTATFLLRFPVSKSKNNLTSSDDPKYLTLKSPYDCNIARVKRVNKKKITLNSYHVQKCNCRFSMENYVYIIAFVCNRDGTWKEN